MTKIEMDAENDKTTKNFDRYKFTNGTVNGSVYLPKGVSKVKVTIEYDGDGVSGGIKGKDAVHIMRNERERLKVNIIPCPIENHHLVYKLYDLIPEEIKIVEEFNEGK